MLIRQHTLEGIAAGRIGLQFRRWKRPTVKAGGTLLTSVGQLAIESVDEVEADALTEADATAAGFSDRDALLAMLDRRPGGVIYRVALSLAGPDPRVALRETEPDAAGLADILTRLERWDGASPVGPWTRTALELIEAAPETLAGVLAERAGVERARFKTNVRKLKSIGLTESLKRGYRLSPRGAAVLTEIRSRG